MTRGMMMAVAGLLLSGMQAPPAAGPVPPLEMWRLDCGSIVVNDYNRFFSDTFAYRPGPKDLVASCYLIRHGESYMLWDTGVSESYIAKPGKTAATTITLEKSIVAQLGEIGVKPGQIDFIGISHHHSDHIGQAARFPKAKLLIGKSDLAALKSKPTPQGMEPALLAPWISGGAPVLADDGDIDVFKDGSVVMLKTPGHTPGHHALLVRLAGGNLMLTGDLYHFREQVLIKGVPPFNTDRADTLASIDRFEKIARNLTATVVIQHEPADIPKLARFPEASR